MEDKGEKIFCTKDGSDRFLRRSGNYLRNEMAYIAESLFFGTS
jgi:hypothetical protein